MPVALHAICAKAAVACRSFMFTFQRLAACMSLNAPLALRRKPPSVEATVRSFIVSAELVPLNVV